MTRMLDIYDSEVLAVTKLLQELQDKARGKKLNYNDFEREIKERFAAIGFTVDVNWYTFSVDGAEQDGAMPEITVTGRTTAEAWDPDRQVHEAVHNILEIPGEEGWIKTDPETLRRFLGDQGGRGHGHGHRH